MGTPSYMAPEQAEGRRESVTTAADVHALGAILFELLTGRPPFRAETMLETLRLVREQDPEHPSAINPRVDRDLETIVLKCLEKAPAQALPFGRSAGRRPRALAGRFADPRRPATLVHRAVKWVRRRPAAAGLILAAAVAALATAAAIRGYISTAELRGAFVDRRKKHQRSQQELVEEQSRKLRMEEESYGQQILSIDRLLANTNPTRDDPAAHRACWKSAHRGCEAGNGDT